MAQMKSFDYYFGVRIGELILRHADNLSKTFQSKTISAAEGQRLAEVTVMTLTKIRSEENFHLFWELAMRYLALMWKSHSFQDKEKSQEGSKQEMESLMFL